MCIQRFHDSQDSAIYITYRISLRSSSMQEPRDPLLKVLFHFQDIKLRQYISQQVFAWSCYWQLSGMYGSHKSEVLRRGKSYLQVKQSSISNRVDKTIGYKKLGVVFQ